MKNNPVGGAGFPLRKALRDDESAIFNLVRTVLAEYGLTTDLLDTDKDLTDLEAFYFNNKGWFWVIENKGVVIGTCGLCRISEIICELRKMYLMPDYQGLGLGKQLLLTALQKAREMGYSEIILETNSRLDKAIGLYQKYGFTQYFPDHLSGRCDLALKKSLLV